MTGIHHFSKFIFNKDQDLYYLHHNELFETRDRQEWDLRMVKKDGSVFWAHLVATLAQNEAGKPICRIVINDITEQKIQRVEKYLLAL